MNELKNWYMSKTVWGGLIAILASCGNLLGLDIAAEDESGLVDGLTALVAAAGGLVAIWGRISARTRLR
jgi:glutamate synthase domain-containing protein 3